VVVGEDQEHFDAKYGDSKLVDLVGEHPELVVAVH